MSQTHYKHPREMLIELTKSEKIDLYRPQKLIEKITQEILLKVQKIMREYRYLNVAQFLRFFMHILKHQTTKDDEFYLMYGLFKVFKQICRSYKTAKVSFSQLSSFITQKMPIHDQQVIVGEKLLPIGFQIPEQEKAHMTLPSITGKVANQRRFLNPNPTLFDRFQHTNRSICQAFYSPVNETYMTIDLPSNFVRITDKSFNQIGIIESELEISKKESVVMFMAWSEVEGRLGVILGNYSLSFWSKEDGFRFEVNVPLPVNNLFNPFVVLGYMESMKQWYVVDNRPVVYGLSSKNFEPVYEIKNFKMIKEKHTQKILTLEMKYQKLLCMGFQRKIFLISLAKREVITEITNFKTSITSMVFLQTYQALFVSNFEIHFKAFELTDYCDLTEKGRLEGHKHQIILLGVVEKKPIVYSLEETWLMKLWDVRDLSCYQTFSVLKNVRYVQMFTVNEGVCLVGSKMYLYKWNVEKEEKSPMALTNQELGKAAQSSPQKVILITPTAKNILIISPLTLKLFSYHNGNLLKVTRGLFPPTSPISFAYLNIPKKQLYLSNDQGHFKVLQTQSFTTIYQFDFLHDPIAMHFSQKEDLITIAVEREIRIMGWGKGEEGFDLKRRVVNERDKLATCKVFSGHDLVTAVYENENDETQMKMDRQGARSPSIGPNTVYFYSFQRGKAIGYLQVSNFIDFQLHPNKNMLSILQTNTLNIYSFTKTLTQLTFTLHYQIKLWSGETFHKELREEFVEYLQTFREKVESKGLLMFQNTCVVVSTFSCLACTVTVDYQALFPGVVEQDLAGYNPYRIAFESHVEAFAEMQPSEVVNKIDEAPKIVLQYNQTRAIAKTVYHFKLGNLLGVYNDKLDLHFFDNVTFKLLGVINSELTLPKMWNMTFYEEAQLEDVDFVLSYIENQEKKKKLPQLQSSNISESQIFALTMNNLKTSSPLKKKPSPLTIEKILMGLGKLSPEKSSGQPNHYSLRQRKLLLQKEREQRQRLQNFLQHQEEEEQSKLRSYHSHDAQANINEILNFFAPNRNEMVKNKGLLEFDMPQIKLLEKKLQNSLKTNEKSQYFLQNTSKNIQSFKIAQNRSQKSIYKLSRPLQKRGSSFSQYTTKNENVFKQLGSLRILQSSLNKLSNDSPYKNDDLTKISEKKFLLKSLDDDVRKSKLSSKQNLMKKDRNSSLPVLKRFKN